MVVEAPIAETAASPDHVHIYEPLGATPWTDDQNGATPGHFFDTSQDEDRSDFSFSFSEDDLLPSRSTAAGGAFGAISYVRAAQPERDASKLYSTTDKAAREPKIQVERAFVVSEPALSPQSPSPVEKKSNRLFRTLSGFRRSTISSTRAASGPSDIQQPKGNLVHTQTIEEERPKSSGRSRERSRGRRKADQPPISEPSALAWLPRPKSLDSKKRQSIRYDRAAIPDQVRNRSPIKRPKTPVSDLDGLKMYPTEQPPSLPQSPTEAPHQPLSQSVMLRRPFARRSLERSEVPSEKDKRKSLRVDTSASTVHKPVPANSPIEKDSETQALSGKQEKRKSLKTINSMSSADQQQPMPLPAVNPVLDSGNDKTRRKSIKAIQRPKDDLWPKFRTLEHEYQK